MHLEFLQELKALISINEDRIAEKKDSKAIIQATVKFLKSKAPDKVEEVEKKFGMTMYAFLKDKILPFSVIMLAQDQFSIETFFEKILEKDKEIKVILDFVPEKEFFDKVDKDFYSLWESAPTSPLELKTGGVHLKMPTESQVKVIDTVFESSGIKNSYKEIYDALANVSKLEEVIKEKDTISATQASEIEGLKRKLGQLTTTMAAMPAKELEVKGDGTIPNGKVVMKSIHDVFPLVFEKSMELEIPTWEWDGPHPLVPAVDPEYIFRPDLLLRVLYALLKNKRMYLHGHTGSGKTTLYQQVAAHLNWPTIRINFDSEITRMDLIGQTELVNKDGAITTQFKEGLLPQMMQMPCIGIFDEIDFCRPDVAYVMQSAVEGNAMRITEDGGREVVPHPMFRMVATGNTVGQGDEMGMYQGARPQSLAFLDRFTIWAEVPYLSENDRKLLIERHVPALDRKMVDTINKYATEHIEGFLGAKVLQPLSPRGILTVAESVMFYTAIGNKNPLKEALHTVVLDRATRGDYAVLKGIIDRVTK